MDDNAVEREGLDALGRVLMRRVRDQSIIDWDMILDGRATSAHSQRVRDSLATLTSEQRKSVEQLIPQIVDTTIHHLLWTFEQEEWIDITVHTGIGIVASAREASDGLSGDHFDWISRFSSQRYDSLY